MNPELSKYTFFLGYDLAGIERLKILDIHMNPDKSKTIGSNEVYVKDGEVLINGKYFTKEEFLDLVNFVYDWRKNEER